MTRAALLLAVATLSACATPITRPRPAPHAPPPPPQQLAPPAAAADPYVDAARDLQLANLELQKVQTYTGLTDAQLAQVRLGELAIARNQGRKAYELLSALTRELAARTNRYVVAAGDSLWVISGREDVYGNSWLWPLIWQANLDRIKDPNRLLTGQKLRIRPNPTIEEVVKAVEYAHAAAGRSVHIGEVQQASP